MQLLLRIGCQALATQDFWHLRQEENENVSDFICKLERTFKLAYGRDPMLREIRAALLYGRMQNRLKDELMAAPAVSGAQNYNQPCLLARNEEKWLLEWRKR